MQKLLGKSKPGQPEITRDKQGLLRIQQPTGNLVAASTALRAFLLRLYHSSPMAGHMGSDRTLEAMRRHFYWPGMKKDIRKWIKSCHTCAIRKHGRPKRHGKPGIVTDAPRPWDTLGVDIVEASAITADGHKYILTCTCLHSRWAIAIPLNSKKAEEVGNAIFNEILCRYGAPRRFLSDQGREFINAGFKAICGKWGIEHTCTGGYQPQALPTERWHRWLNHMMTALSAKFGQAWNTYIQAVVFNYNMTTCASTGYAPFELMFGRAPGLLQDLTWTRKSSQGPANTQNWGESMVDRMSNMYKLVRKQQQKMAEKNQARSLASKIELKLTP